MRRNSLLISVVLLATTAISACSQKAKIMVAQKTARSVTGLVEHVIEPPDNDHRYKQLPGITFIPATPLDNEKPIYPPLLLSRKLEPIKVSVALIVDQSGVVTSVTPINNEGVPSEFIDATVAAVSTWGFAPLEQFDGNKYEQLPYSETYTFLFKQVDGKPVVE